MLFGGLWIPDFFNPLEPKPLPQPLSPQSMMDLYCSYYQDRGHATYQCTTLRHAIQDIIDRVSMSVDQLDAVADPLIAHSALHLTLIPLVILRMMTRR